MINFFSKKLKGYRTFAINMLLVIMPILEMSEVLDVMPQGWEAPYAILIAVLNLYLRSITSTPPGRAQ